MGNNLKATVMMLRGSWQRIANIRFLDGGDQRDWHVCLQGSPRRSQDLTVLSEDEQDLGEVNVIYC